MLDLLSAFTDTDTLRNLDSSKDNEHDFKFSDVVLTILANTVGSDFNLSIKEIAAADLSEDLLDDFKADYGIPAEYKPESSLIELGLHSANGSSRRSARFSASSDDISGKAELQFNFVAQSNRRYMTMYTSKDRTRKVFTPISDVTADPASATIEINNLSGQYILLSEEKGSDTTLAEGSVRTFDIQINQPVFAATGADLKFTSDIKITADLITSASANTQPPVLKMKSSEKFELGSLKAEKVEDYWTAEERFLPGASVTSGDSYTYEINLAGLTYDSQKHPGNLLIWAEYEAPEALYKTATILSVRFVKDAYVVSTVPRNRTREISVESPITITFSEAIEDSCKKEVIVKEEGEIEIPELVRKFSAENKVLTIQPPANNWRHGTRYEVSVPDTVKTVAGAGVIPETFYFTTEILRPYVVSSVPENGAQNVAINSPITITFSENIDKSALDKIRVTEGGNEVYLPERSFDDNDRKVVTISPVRGNWKNNTKYTVSVPETIKNDAGISVVPKTFSFTVTGPLNVSSVVQNPANDEPFVFEFTSEPENFDVLKHLVVNKAGECNLISGTDYTVETSGKKVSVKPIGLWECGGNYVASFSADIVDSTGNRMPGDVSIPVVVHMFGGGAGTSEEPYLIRNAYHLDNIRGADYLNKHYRQTANIDLLDYLERGCTPGTVNNNLDWLPIGNENLPFKGLYDGKNCSLTGLWIGRPEETHVGLFGQIKGGIVKNLKVEIAPQREVAGKLFVGGIVGKINGGEIENCSVKGRIKGQMFNVGGIAGYCESDSIKSSIKTCTVYGSETYIYANNKVEYGILVGGIVGGLEGLCEVKDCVFSDGKVEAESQVGGIVGSMTNKTSISGCNVNNGEIIVHMGGVGGIVGSVESYTWTPENRPHIINCHINNTAVTSLLKSGAAYAGGIAGDAEKSRIEGCTVKAAVGVPLKTIVKVENVAYAGGIAGHLADKGEIIDCTFSDGKIEGGDLVGGIAGGISTETLLLNCNVNNGEIIGNNMVGGIVGHAEAYKAQEIRNCGASSSGNKVISSGAKDRICGDGNPNLTGTTTGNGFTLHP